MPQGNRRIASGIIGALFAVLAAVPDLVSAGTAEWRNNWSLQSPFTLARYFAPLQPDRPSVATAFADNGDILLGASSNTGADLQFVRMDRSGSLRWSANFADTPSMYGAYAVVPTSDGGTLLAFGYPEDGVDTYDRVVRLDASGAVTWWRRVPSGWLVTKAPGRLVSASCRVVTVLDASNGSVLWQREITSSQSCKIKGVAGDASGNVYGAFRAVGDDGTVRMRVVKFDADGDESWNVSSTKVASGVLLGLDPDNGILYVRMGTDLRALRANDGSTIWSIPVDSSARVVLTADNSPEPVVVESGAVTRLAHDSGQPRWVQPLDIYGKVLNAVDDSLLVQTLDGIVKLDAASGAVDWTTPVPFSDALSWLAFGGLDGGEIIGVAKVAGDFGSASPPLVQRFDFAAGTPSTTIEVPVVDQGLPYATTLLEDAGHVVQTAVSDGTDFQEIHIRRLDAATGVVLWETTDVVSNVAGRMSQPTATVAGDAIAVAGVINLPSNFSGNVGVGFGVVALYDRATGAHRWQSVFRDQDQGLSYASAPAADAEGNVFVAFGSVLSCENGGFCGRGRQTLYKLSAVDGSVLWRFANETSVAGSQVFPQYFVVAGSAVVVAGPFAQSTNALRGLSGNDGSVQWTSDIFAPLAGFPYQVDEDHVIVSGSISGMPAWAKLDPSTGAPLWTSTSTPSPVCTLYCYRYDNIVLPNGDLVSVGENEFKPVVTRRHGDGSGVVDNWMIEPNDPGLRSFVSRVQSDAAGNLWLTLYRRERRWGHGGIGILARFDTDSGTLLGQQVLSAGAPDSAMTLASIGALLQIPESDRILAGTYVTQPTAPTTTGAALIDTGVSANGNLAVQVTADRTGLVPGQSLGFHMKVTYTGDQPIEGAHLVAYTPWNTTATGLNCSSSGASNCTIDTHTAAILAAFDVLPGGSIDISGQIHVQHNNGTSTLSAFAYGPISLSESDTVDNFAQATVEQSLFADGFE